MAISSFMPPPADGSEPRSKAKPAVPPAEPALRWDEGLRLGVEEIDAQHQALLGHCNELVEAIRQGHGAEALGKTMAKLRDYTATHFAAEERYMERIGYPELAAHRAAHEGMVRRVKEFQRRIYQHAAPAPAEVRGFLKDWLITHILGTDLKIAAFVRQRAAAPQAAPAPEPSAEPSPESSGE